ncbi:OmpA family protein [Endozoicomonas gorgoniicola]|uniref:OmpA family protein n=1 Tax=Endozoicomonas gorgoniicola TaxID=1234144 RepID=A0ABT3MX08_9GAMM|nr:OmpA family protein [Endozoicomonas gorgoniicola]MCW7553514.1 OmpA family protein [Endozoicomonas gorgoniicola]
MVDSRLRGNDGRTGMLFGAASLTRCHRLQLTVLLFLSLLLTGCVSTEELYAEYDFHMCPVVEPFLQSPAPGLRWHSAVYFSYNKSALAEDENRKLQDNLELLTMNPDYRVVLRGFADSVATQRYNLPLSERRSKFVADWLIDNGLAAARIDHVGLGKDLLLIAPAEGQNEDANRRVEMLLLDSEGRVVTLEQPLFSGEPESDDD